ncbi:MAG: sulfatase-like hydrolase/transferase [Woeseiaceae bacterium]|nr:sulfatase-like hydrolase/transferase [Woeseiaceae bacterium]
MKHHIRINNLLGICLLFAGIVFLQESTGAAAEKPSILFVNIDDLNDWNEVLNGHPQAITPNIRRMAEMGTAFSNCICPSPVCFPSRTAVFSGIHPA